MQTPELFISKPIVSSPGNSRRWKYTTPRDRFDAAWIPEPTTGCWLWTGTLNAQGYGRFLINYRLVLVHRYSYQEFCGPLIEGLVIDHKCRMRCCVNPDHLEQVTQSENARRVPLSSACSRGHPWVPETTRLNPKNNSRQCRICIRINQQVTRSRKSPSNTETKL